MIINFFSKKHKTIALSLLFIMFANLVLPLKAAVGINNNEFRIVTSHLKSTAINANNSLETKSNSKPNNDVNIVSLESKILNLHHKKNIKTGPTSPEATSFKPVGMDNLVNLFNGDFNYSIPLLDVGGYPVNLFYSGGIRMEDEASWVGLGWNINPGSITRGLRGIPDDFNGDDLLIQEQNTKPNRTWGGTLGGDLEFFGIKKPRLNGNVGLSYNNYLGPEMSIGSNFSASLINVGIINSVGSEKMALNVGLKLGINLSSRNGLSINPSLNASLATSDNKHTLGLGLSTSYNSRHGIKALNFAADYRFFNIAHDDVLNRDGEQKANVSIASSSINFAKPTYIPTLRMPMEYSNTTGSFEFGKGKAGLRKSGTLTGYYSESSIPIELQRIEKPLYGFIHSDKAIADVNAVMDFNRVNDGEITPASKIISSTQYAYDIFNIQGEGTGGVIRAFRNDVGFMKDNETKSKEKSITVGIDIAPPTHWGGNFNHISTPTRVGNWTEISNILNSTLTFQNKASRPNSSFENVYFKNPGEMTVSNVPLINQLGEDNLVRFKLGGTDENTILESKLELFDKSNSTISKGNDISFSYNQNMLIDRDKRSQIVTFLNADEASKAGLDLTLDSYDGTFSSSRKLSKVKFPRVDANKKPHHISEINVLESSGMRYVYGLPTYNLYQREYTFSVNATTQLHDGVVQFNPNEASLGSIHNYNSSKIDGYYMSQKTPAYANAFLITGLLSPDYVDVTNNGITEDDLGNAVKFNYTKSQNHKWKTPRSSSNTNVAHFNAGLRSERKDDKAVLTCGLREVWYLQSIESKTMIAIFGTGERKDGKGIEIESASEPEYFGNRNDNEQANKRLNRIDLYSKADIVKNGIQNAKPIKTVHFEYDYNLCGGVPDNNGQVELVNGNNVNVKKGKLTLRRIYFSYNGQYNANTDKYLFKYGDENTQEDNPNYAYQSSDRWGTFKNKSENPSNMDNSDFPYTSKSKIIADRNSSAWCLKQILLPSGGQMDIKYESDDYGFVQNKVACNMYKILGFTRDLSSAIVPNLYRPFGDNLFAIVKLEDAITATNLEAQKNEIFQKYLIGTKQLAFKLSVRTPKATLNNEEPLIVYAEFDDYGVFNQADKSQIYIRLKPLDGKSPLAKMAINFLTENLPGQAFPGYEVDGNLLSFLGMIGGMLSSLTNVFNNKEQQIRSAGKASLVNVNRSFVRLNNPNRLKFGGGNRVKEITMSDNWDRMTSQYKSTYGSRYEYTTNEVINGETKVISSGVASYEPGIGSDENPFREIFTYSNSSPLSSAIYGSVEMPTLDAFFPSPSVGYSKVTVRSIHNKNNDLTKALKSGIGKQVTQFYTAKDYPTKYAMTDLVRRDFEYNSIFDFFHKDIINRSTLSQGFLVETNDMHGKKKSQEAFSESDEKTPLSGSYHTYKNTGVNGLNDKIDFVYKQTGGGIQKGIMGVDMELMTDVREHSVNSSNSNLHIQLDILFPPAFALPIFHTYVNTENTYRAVSTTKLINYHAIEDVVTVMDKGSIISTQTIAYDAETGQGLITKTNNEFKDPIYNISYPAHWAYSSMEPAYKNIDRQLSGLNFVGGRLVSGLSNVGEVFESGDELLIINTQTSTDGCVLLNESPNYAKIWVYDENKNTTPFTVPAANRSFVFLDQYGMPYTKSGVVCRIIRSGKRNLIGNNLASYTAMENPIVANKLTLPLNKIVNASAIEYKEKWQNDIDVFGKGKWVYNEYNCTFTFLADCGGNFENSINPYLKGLVGNTKPYKSLVYYGDRAETNTSPNTTDIRTNGLFANFAPYWVFNTPHNNVVKNTAASSKWQWKTELTKVNSKGKELETVNALGIFTSSQNGYAKNMPTTVVNNSRYNESMFEGFEDAKYLENINEVNPFNVCDNRHIAYENDNLTKTSITNFNMHTGDYAYKNMGNTLVTKIPITSNIPSNFAIQYTPKQEFCYTAPTGVVLKKAESIYSPGQDLIQPSLTNLFHPSINGVVKFENNELLYGFSYHYTYPYQNAVNSNTECLGSILNKRDNNGSSVTNGWSQTTAGTTSFDLKLTNEGFFNIVNDNSHTINIDLDFNAQMLCDSKAGVVYAGFKITDRNGNVIRNFNESEINDYSCYLDISDVVSDIGIEDNSTKRTIPICLERGSYKLEIIVLIKYETVFYNSISGNKGGQPWILQYSIVSNQTNNRIPIYKTDNMTQTGSINTLNPVATHTDMFNPTFTIKPNQKMLLSSWVREDCTIPCSKTNYTNSSIQLVFKDASNNVLSGSTVTINPTGNIIEGWQKVEGEFTAPANAASMEIYFASNGSGITNYWDDLRIHPINANMKSFVYDPITLKLIAELDENNYASFYEYDEESQLIRVKKETIHGVKTIKETRSSKQKVITNF